MVVSRLNGKYKGVAVASALISFLVFVQPNRSFSGEMPLGAKVQSGDVTITGTNTNHMIIDSNSQKSIINWNSFSIHKQGRVDFNQPSASSFSLNRVKAQHLQL